MKPGLGLASTLSWASRNHEGPHPWRTPPERTLRAYMARRGSSARLWIWSVCDSNPWFLVGVSGQRGTTGGAFPELGRSVHVTGLEPIAPRHPAWEVS